MAVIEERQHQLRGNVPEEPVWVEGDAHLIKPADPQRLPEIIEELSSRSSLWGCDSTEN